MSALSNCVTCGIAFQAWLRCSAVLRRMPVIGLRSTSPHFAKSGSAGPTPTGAAAPLAAAAWPLPPRLFITRLANSLTSSCVMRPPGPVPATWLTSTPISRASRRTDGAAGAEVTCDAAAGGGAGAAPALRDAPPRCWSPRLAASRALQVRRVPQVPAGACRSQSGLLRGAGALSLVLASALRLRSAPLAPEAPLAPSAPFSSVSTA